MYVYVVIRTYLSDYIIYFINAYYKEFSYLSQHKYVLDLGRFTLVVDLSPSVSSSFLLTVIFNKILRSFIVTISCYCSAYLV